MFGGPPRILVADDDPQTCAMLRYVLEDEGFVVETVGDTASVSALVQAGGIDLLILDVAIGPVDGLTLLARLRERPCCPPAVFLSGRDEPATRLRAFELGALDYMTKPIDVVELAARVRVAVRRGHRERRRSQRAVGQDSDLQGHGRLLPAGAQGRKGG